MTKNIYKSTQKRRDDYLKFTQSMIDYHILLDGEWQSKSDVFDRHYKETRYDDPMANTNLEMVMARCHPMYSYIPRPMEWKDTSGIVHKIDKQYSGAEAEDERLHQIIAQRCVDGLRKHEITAKDDNDITLSYDKMLSIVHDIAYKVATNAFKIWEEI